MSDQHKPQPTLSEAEQTELHQSLTANAGPVPGTTPPAPYPVFDANGRWPGQDEVSGMYLNETKVFNNERELGNVEGVPERADIRIETHADGKAVDTKRLEYDKNLAMMRRMRGDIGAKMSTNANLSNGPFPASSRVNDVSDLMFLTARSLGKTDPTQVLQMLRGKSRPEYDYPKRTPLENQKVRNSCLSGHSGEAEREVCQYCQKARFYSLTTGYHSDMPTTDQVEKFLIGDGWRERDQDAYAFALNYLGVGDVNLDNTWVQERFIAKLRALDYLLGYMPSGRATYRALHPVSREYRPLPDLVSGKSAAMVSIVARDELLTEIYAQATTYSLEGMFDSEVYSDHFLGKKYGHSGAVVKALLGDTHGLRHTANPVSIRNMTQAEVAEDLTKPKPKPSPLMQALLKKLDK